MQLTSEERRVLGCLVEKERTTPQAYPLTLNSLRLACNQTTARDPVVRYEDRDVETALTSLRAAGLIRIVHSPHNRAAKYRHVLGDVLEIGDAGVALLAALMLRGPQTVGELHARTERLHRFEGMSASPGRARGPGDQRPAAGRAARAPSRPEGRPLDPSAGRHPHGRADPRRRRVEPTSRTRPTGRRTVAAAGARGARLRTGWPRRCAPCAAEVHELRAVVDQLREALGD